jgi:ubiquinone/menaquinone biosynthesis C-methylase UbiE
MAKVIRQQPDQTKKLKILDVAGGTGDVAFRFVEAAGCSERAWSSGEDPITVTVCDINPEMLRVGEARARDRYGSSLLDGTKALSFVEGNAQSLDFPDNSFDLYTIAFGLRNVTDVVSTLWKMLSELGVDSFTLTPSCFFSFGLTTF